MQQWKIVSVLPQQKLRKKKWKLEFKHFFKLQGWCTFFIRNTFNASCLYKNTLYVSIITKKSLLKVLNSYRLINQPTFQNVQIIKHNKSLIYNFPSFSLPRNTRRIHSKPPENETQFVFLALPQLFLFPLQFRKFLYSSFT